MYWIYTVNALMPWIYTWPHGEDGQDEEADIPKYGIAKKCDSLLQGCVQGLQQGLLVWLVRHSLEWQWKGIW